MRKRITSLFMSVAIVLSFTPQAYALPDHAVYHRVYYSCTVGPYGYGLLQGEWTIGCDGNWTGWGWRPYEHSCVQWVESETLESCDPL